MVLQLVVCITAVCFLSGCSDEFWDPTQIGRFRPVPAVNVILDSLGVADEKSSEWAGAEDPKPIDVMIFETDHTFAAGDTLRVSVYELLEPGQMFVDSYVVTETGKISIPEIGVIEVTGLTESQLSEEIKRILSPSILKEPVVTVISLSSERRTFSILGSAVPNPGRYGIPRYDFRLNDALAISGVSAQFNTSYIYVTRAITQRELAYDSHSRRTSTNNANRPNVTDKELLEVVSPRAGLSRPNNNLVITTTEMSIDSELSDMAKPQSIYSGSSSNTKQQTAAEQSGDVEWIFRDGQWVPVQVGSVEPRPSSNTEQQTAAEQSGNIEWIFRDGKWVPVQVGSVEPRPRTDFEREQAVSTREPLRQQLPETFDWEQLGVGAVQTRVIKIPSDKLAGGDPRYNVVIRPGDTVHVPLDIIGEFAIMGNVNSQGYINLTGRPMTLKMAIAAAGGLGPLAWPKRCEVTRRIGKNKEETVMVDLDKIAKGLEPDFFIKPNDLINVGTHPTSRWRAVLRNSFRATYGFGFVYDRNFADRDFGTSRPIPNWF
ncbi:MAG: polysaccharide biosynthesis/export family protein [Phycisphaerae bacterium]